MRQRLVLLAPQIRDFDQVANVSCPAKTDDPHVRRLQAMDLASLS
jgi:hypothetical protein